VLTQGDADVKFKSLLTFGLLACATLGFVMNADAWFADTNATTSPTLYVPSNPGDILVGSLGGTDTIWFAQASGAEPTTNDWVAYTVGAPNATVAAAGTFGLLTVGTNFVNGSSGTNGPGLVSFPQYPAGAQTVTNAPASTNPVVWLKLSISNRPGVIPWLPLNN
jgi:hypothetical protein